MVFMLSDKKAGLFKMEIESIKVERGAGYLPDGSQMHFIEPMISQEVLLGGQDFTLPVPMPQRFGREMLYPTQFQALFHGNAYSFVFGDFVPVR